MVLCEQGQHAAGGLGAFGDVVVLERGLFPVVADGMEVEVEPGVAGGEAKGAEPADQLAERGGVHLAAHPVGVAGSVGGVWQHVQPDGQAQGAIRGQFGGVGDPVAAQQLQAEQGGHRVPGREAAGGGVAAGCDDLGQAELHHGGQQHEQPGVVAFDAGARRPGPQRLGPDGFDAGCGAVAAPDPGRQSGQALLGEDHPHRLVADRRAFGGERVGDLFDRAVLGSQVEHPVARGGGLARPFGPGLEDTKNFIRPARSSAAIWYMVALEEPKRGPATSAASSCARRRRTPSGRGVGRGRRRRGCCPSSARPALRSFRLPFRRLVDRYLANYRAVVRRLRGAASHRFPRREGGVLAWPRSPLRAR